MHSGSCLRYSHNAWTQTGCLCFRIRDHWLPFRWATCSLFSSLTQLWGQPRGSGKLPESLIRTQFPHLLNPYSQGYGGLWCTAHTTERSSQNVRSYYLQQPPSSHPACPPDRNHTFLPTNYNQTHLYWGLATHSKVTETMILRRSQSHTPASCEQQKCFKLQNLQRSWAWGDPPSMCSRQASPCHPLSFPVKLWEIPHTLTQGGLLCFRRNWGRHWKLDIRKRMLGTLQPHPGPREAPQDGHKPRGPTGHPTASLELPGPTPLHVNVRSPQGHSNWDYQDLDVCGRHSPIKLWRKSLPLRIRKSTPLLDMEITQTAPSA